MADNTTLNTGSGGDLVVTREVAHAGDTAKLPGTFVMGISGTEGSYTIAAIDGDATNGLDVDVTRLQGTDAENAAVTAKPVLTGGRYDATPRTLGDGDAGAIALNASGQVILADMSTLIDDVDGLEALLTTIDADTGSMAANLTTIAGAVSGTEFQVDVLSSALPTGAATSANQTTIIGHLDGVEGLLTTIDADTGSIASDLTTLAGAVSGTEMQVDVVAALPAGTNNIGDVDIATIQAATSGGASVFRSIDLDESEEEVKATAGQLYGGVVMNMSASVRYLKFYNATAANVTVGTTTPVLTIPIPTAGDTNGAGFLLPFPAQGVAFDTAITVAATTGLADNNTGAPGANEVVVNLFYK